MNRSVASALESELAADHLRARGPIVRAELHGPGGSVVGDALIDTGAHSTFLDEAAVQELGLEPISSTAVIGVAGTRREPTYSATVTFPESDFPPVRFKRVISSDALSDLGIVALIGRDALAHADLYYSGKDGRFAMTPHGDEPIMVEATEPPIGVKAVVGAVVLAGVVGLVAWAAKPCPPCAAT